MSQKEAHRPAPEDILREIRREGETRGELNVFLGAVAGVGKTFAMLKMAHEKLQEGVDIVIGWVETHGRADTEKIAEGIARIAPKEVAYKGKILYEMDIDAILARRPQIVIVDELAHTNIFGSRHRRRYQDVEELLAAGIHVYTAVNIQHIESLNDIVARITGVVVRETVPDSVLQRADFVQLVDIVPEDLRKRLKDGKIYLPAQAQNALKNFFRLGNINALRELSLRFMAQRVDQDMEEYMHMHHIQGPWQAAGRVMVGVSGSPFSAQLIRAAARLAAGLRSELLAVHIEEARARFPIGEKERDRIARNMRLAEDLGAQTITIIGENFTDEFLEAARRQNVSAVVVGKPRITKWRDRLRGSVVDKIIARSGDIHVYVIQGREEEDKARDEMAVRQAKSGCKPFFKYALSIGMVAALSAVFLFMRSYLEPMDVALLYIIPVLLSAVWWGRWPSYAAAVIAVMSFDYFFVDPVLTLDIEDLRYLWSFFIFLFISFLIGGRTEKMRLDARTARQQEKSTRAVYEFSRDIAAVSDVKSIVKSLASQAGWIIDRRIVVSLGKVKSKEWKVYQFNPAADGGGRLIEKLLPEGEAAVVDWVYQHAQPAGRTTDTLPSDQYLYLPLGSQENMFGVFGIDLEEDSLTPAKRRLIDAWLRLAIVAIEKAKLTEQAQQAHLLIEADKLRNALFNSLSHELKTPLSAIIGSVSTLLEEDARYSPSDRQELLNNIQESSLRMHHLIMNLLDSARIESGMMNLKLDWCDIQDIIGTVLRKMQKIAKEHKIAVKLADDLPLLQADCVLIEQVLINLVDNAVKYSPKQSQITILAEPRQESVMVSVFNIGSQIPENDLQRIFDKFYRARQQCKTSGTGLGLSICRGIIEAHGGRIYAENDDEGCVIRFVLPVKIYKKEYEA